MDLHAARYLHGVLGTNALKRPATSRGSGRLPAKSMPAEGWKAAAVNMIEHPVPVRASPAAASSTTPAPGFHQHADVAEGTPLKTIAERTSTEVDEKAYTMGFCSRTGRSSEQPAVAATPPHLRKTAELTSTSKLLSPRTVVKPKVSRAKSRPEGIAAVLEAVHKTVTTQANEAPDVETEPAPIELTIELPAPEATPVPIELTVSPRTTAAKSAKRKSAPARSMPRTGLKESHSHAPGMTPGTAPAIAMTPAAATQHKAELKPQYKERVLVRSASVGDSTPRGPPSPPTIASTPPPSAPPRLDPRHVDPRHASAHASVDASGAPLPPTGHACGASPGAGRGRVSSGMLPLDCHIGLAPQPQPSTEELEAGALAGGPLVEVVEHEQHRVQHHVRALAADQRVRAAATSDRRAPSRLARLSST